MPFTDSGEWYLSIYTFSLLRIVCGINIWMSKINIDSYLITLDIKVLQAERPPLGMIVQQ
jgi:hypothetical protein